MLIDSRTLENPDIQGSVAVIGGGAAGISLALELAKNFSDVLLIESGGLEPDPEVQALYEGPVIGHPNTDLASSRLRFLGGTTNHWNGQCAPLDQADFTGWPFKLDELTPYYQQAFEYCQLGAYRDHPVFLDRARIAARQIVESHDFELTEFRFSPPTRFGQRYRHDLESSERIKVHLNANVVDFSVADNGRTILTAQIKTLNGRHFDVKASAFVLCCGGVENPRILLNCTSRSAKGLGNEHDLVGRFFMDHLITFGGSIVPSRGNIDLRALEPQTDGGTQIRMVLKNSTETVRRRGYGGCSIFFQPVIEVPEAAKQARQTAAFLAMQDLLRNSSRAHWPQDFVEKGCTVLSNLSAIATAAYYQTQKASLQSVAVFLEGEQAPSPDSRVVLLDERDALGMRKVALDWKIVRHDYDNLLQTVTELARGVGASGFGRMQIVLKEGDTSSISTAWHHMGTTRMHDDRTRGVVDRNCRVHEIENLFIAGSSVFPTGGRVNPTLTIVALAIRLAEHLRTRLQL